jgi:hypothetical protein
MARSQAATVQAYLEELPEERRAVIAAVRDVIVRHLPAGYCEAMNWGVINYEIPLKRFPDTYNGHPLMYVGLSAQKNYYAVYLMCVYGDEKRARWLKEEFQKAGKKLDMGQCCVRFRRLEDLPLDVIAQAVASTTPEQYIAHYKASRQKQTPKSKSRKR